MVTNNAVLVLSDDEARSHDISTILEFIGEERVLSGTAARELIGSPATGVAADVAIIDGDIRGVVALVREVCRADRGLPILMIGDPALKGLSAEDSGRIIARMEWPLNYTKFIDSLHRAQVFRDQYSRSRDQRGMQRGLQLFRSLVGTSRGIQAVRQLMQQVADKEVTVLVTGEAGTGKEVVARNLHYHSPRREQPFVPVNCGAIPPDLLESELFGYEKGAFSGAITSRIGRIELAEGGTLFIDEVSELPPGLQVKLLRLLQDGVYERVGSNRTQAANLRIIAASNHDLEERVATGRFREELYYALNVFPIDMPALRDRVEDIPLLVNELIARMEKERRGSLRINSGAIMSLCRHDWPGNVRELANLVERLAIMHPYGVIGVQELPKKFRYVDDFDENRGGEEAGLPAGIPGLVGLDAPALLPVNGIDLKEYLANLEKQLIQQALDETGGVVARAAEKLRIRRTTLVEKVRKYGLRENESEDA